MVKAKKWIFAKHFDGLPKDSDFRLEEEELGELKDGEILIETEYLSVDPYMRPYTRNLPEGIVMIGTHVAKVIESKAPDYPVGTYVVSNSGWRTHSIADPKKSSGAMPLITKIPNIGDLPKSLGIGTLGMPGVTAYYGFLRICEPKSGETVVVNAAAGAVGSLVGQIAKIKGCRVIGYAGSDEKCKWIKEELGFDFAFNYKTTDLNQTLKEAAPKGVDCYFDNVGGIFTETVLQHMNSFGRISLCGSITSYNLSKPDPGQYPYMLMIQKNLKMEGFLVPRWLPEWPEAILQMAKWIKEGKVKYRETFTEGFENMPKAFKGLFTGENTGKSVVKV